MKKIHEHLRTAKSSFCSAVYYFRFCLPSLDLVDRHDSVSRDLLYPQRRSHNTPTEHTYATLSRTCSRIDSGDKNCGRAARYRPTDASGRVIIRTINNSRTCPCETAPSGKSQIPRRRANGAPKSSSAAFAEFVAESTRAADTYIL